MSYCSNCGKQLNQKGQFCPFCGKSLKSNSSVEVNKSLDTSIPYKYTTRDIILFSSAIVLLILAMIIYSLHNGPVTTFNGIFWAIVSAVLAWFSIKPNQCSNTITKVSNIKKSGNFCIGVLYFATGFFLDDLYAIFALAISLFYFVTYLNKIKKIPLQDRRKSERILFPVAWVFVGLISLAAFGYLIELLSKR